MEFLASLTTTYWLSSRFKLETTPGQANDFWAATGIGGGVGQYDKGEPGPGLWHYSTGGGLVQITNMGGVYCVGFGYNGGGYPSVYVAGFRTLDRGATYTYGIWQSDDAGTAGATPTWKQIGPFPGRSLDTPTSISGDPAVYGRAYVELGGSGYAVIGP